MGEIGMVLEEPTGLILGKFRSRPKAEVIDEADCDSNLGYQPIPIYVAGGLAERGSRPV